MARYFPNVNKRRGQVFPVEAGPDGAARAGRWRARLTGVLLLASVGFCCGAEFFPIGVWLQDPTNAAAFRAAGINTYVGLWQGPTAQQLTTLQQAGLRVVCAQNHVALRHPATTNILAWMHGDEPDNARTRGARLGFGSPVTPAQIQADYRALKQNDPSRPVFLNLGQGVAWDGWYGRGRRNHHPEDYPEYVKGADLVSFDIYPANHDRPEIAGNLWYVAAGIERLRRWTRDEKPVWNCIETTRIGASGRKPTPSEVRAEVWMSLIHGSRGIIYFAHQFGPPFVEAALLQDQEMLATITAVNRQITALAPVLNSPSRPDAVKIQCRNAAVPVAALAQTHAGFTYVCAVAMRPGTNTAQFTLTNPVDATSVEVIGENRTLPLAAGAFADHFGPWEVHLYRMESGAGR